MNTPSETHQASTDATPHRVQLSRRIGWRLPANTVVVARPSPFGNPYTLEQFGPAARCVKLFRYFLANTIDGHNLVKRAKEELRGKNLACWCPLDAPCHADVLLKIANADAATKRGRPACQRKGSAA